MTLINPLRLLQTLLGILFALIGIINIFWGNDPEFGVFVFLLSFIFYPFIQDAVTKWSGYSIHWGIKLAIALFILWASLGVGELFDKIEMMLQSF